MAKIGKLALPSLRGTFGKWIYYVCLMPAGELARRAHFATEVHKSKELSDLIQRALEGSRSRRIAQYLAEVEDRFFNSLVLATYGGEPTWFELTNFQTRIKTMRGPSMDREKVDGIGFLELSGSEKIFALDGQHRLAGIKQAISDHVNLDGDSIPVILIGHAKTKAGLQRTRRLFTTLNKTAKAVKKSDIIALDEDDVMAIVARRLVEDDPRFAPPKILVSGASSMPPTNRESLTSIINLYDVLKIIYGTGRTRIDALRFNRPSDERLDGYYKQAREYFDALARAFDPIAQVLKAEIPGLVTRVYRGPHGGHLLFRPMGLEIFTRAAIAYSARNKVDLPTAVDALRDLPVNLTEAPYVNVIWSESKSRMITKGKSLAQALVHYMAGNLTEEPAAKLLEQYRAAVEDWAAQLPDRVGRTVTGRG
jgi:DNA sulfur modification protein DndB